MNNRNSILYGVLIAISTLALSAIVLGAIVWFWKGSLVADPKIYLFSFVAPALLLRFHLKQKSHIKTATAIIVVMLMSMIVYLFWLRDLQII